MSDITTIIDLMTTIADDYCDVTKLIFDESACLNDDRGKTYPIVLVECNGIDIDYPKDINRSNLPKESLYKFPAVYFVEPYNKADENSGKTKQEALDDVIRYKNQFFAEMKRRVLEQTGTPRITDVKWRDGYVASKTFNDCLAIAVCKMWVTCSSDCVTGQFDNCP